MKTFSDLQPKIVLGVAAHPDDLDFGAGGTLAQFARQGADVYYVQLTDGGKGTADTSIDSESLRQTREAEQQRACEAIGGKGITFLNHPDGQLEVTMDLKAEIVKLIRSIKPDVVVTTDPSEIYDADRGIINHPDHRAAGQATLDAVYPLARDYLSFPELYKAGYEPHKVTTVLMTNFSRANFYVNISDTIELKLQAAAAHASQGGASAMQDMLRQFAADRGEAAGYSYAEGFVRIDVMP